MPLALSVISLPPQALIRVAYTRFPILRTSGISLSSPRRAPRATSALFASSEQLDQWNFQLGYQRCREDVVFVA